MHTYNNVLEVEWACSLVQFGVILSYSEDAEVKPQFTSCCQISSQSSLVQSSTVYNLHIFYEQFMPQHKRLTANGSLTFDSNIDNFHLLCEI